MKTKVKNILIILIFCVYAMINFFVLCCSQEVDEVMVILHAGGSMDNISYLNSQEAFYHYYDEGCRYFEYDLKLSNDGKIIGTHYWDHLSVTNPETIMYDEFKKLKLDSGHTPVNEEWLIRTIQLFPDVKIIVDAKMDSNSGDADVLMRIEELGKLHNIDLSSNIIPEIFSKEMWDLVKDRTSFDKYIFSRYKVNYTVDQIIEYFGDERFWAVGISTSIGRDFINQIHKLKDIGKKILVFTPTTKTEIENAVYQLKADFLYLDSTTLPER